MLDTQSPNSQRQSPSMSKKQLNAKAKAKPKSTVLSENDIPKLTFRTDDGVTTEAFQFLERANTFAQMQSLMVFAQQSNQMSGQAALQRYTESNQHGQLQNQHQINSLAAAQQGHPQLNFPPGANGFPQGPGFAMRNTGMGNQYASPGNPNLGLPNANMTASPHLRPGGSPGQPGLPPHMQGTPVAAQMVAQQSAQGTNSSAPSSNASPNNANKKRRASQVKPDGQEPGGMPQVNGVMDKSKTAKLNQQKRQRAN